MQIKIKRKSIALFIFEILVPFICYVFVEYLNWCL